MIQCSPSTLVKKTQKIIDELTDDLYDISGGNIGDYHDTLVDENLFPFSGEKTNADIFKYFVQKTNEYITFCKSTGLFPVDSVPDIDWTPSYKQKSSPLASYIDKGPYEALLDNGIFWISPVPEPVNKETYLGLKNIYHKQFMNSITIHEVIGHHTASENLEKNLDNAFTFSSNLTYDEGFALYVEDVFTQAYVDQSAMPAKEKDHMLFFQKKAALLRAHRVIVDIGLGTGEMDINDASKYYADKNEFPLETARNECEKFYLNPGTASSYFIGKLEICEIRNLLKKQHGENFSLNRFNKLMVSFGSIPIALIRRKILETITEMPEEP